MKVPIDDYACLDLDAPTLPAHEIAVDGVTRWRVWSNTARVGIITAPVKDTAKRTATMRIVRTGEAGTIWR